MCELEKKYLELRTTVNWYSTTSALFLFSVLLLLYTIHLSRELCYFWYNRLKFMGPRYIPDYVYNTLAEKNPRIFIRLKKIQTSIIIVPEQ